MKGNAGIPLSQPPYGYIKNPDDPARDSGRNFAIKNIVRQLRLYYRDEYRFSITSSTGQGTTVHLAFPLKVEDAHE